MIQKVLGTRNSKNNKNYDPVKGKIKVKRFDLRIPIPLWQKLMKRKAETDEDITAQILNILEQTLD